VKEFTLADLSLKYLKATASFIR